MATQTEKTKTETPEPISAKAQRLLAAFQRATADESKFRQKSEDASEKRTAALKALREQEGWTMTKIAEKTGMTRQRVQQLVSKQSD